ncbi:DUF3558 domain-containing protein [Aequorivita antarctica]|uniref:DUF3558 domain-containing protein n=1 Tax=Aequorivita antarctica TaxID=153266 RepID=A0A5C6YYB8_9FLAO|nr:DUF3558 domain-containing protein [Aequorivita antarctica]TXD72251.1 DUF3558 domain-containing protein [Aequorivita antarctica]SRX74381.1 hypothetical protein AEQU3_01359 [Aequorivita antarctica]
MKKALLLITACILAIACGNSETSKSENPQTEAVATEKAVEPTATESASSPCGFVTETKIKEVLGIAADATTEMRDVMRTYPTCFYKWESVMFSTKRTIAGKEVSLDFPAEVAIILVKDATPQMFETSTKVYKDGEAIEGLADMAIWGSTRSQLTFLAKGTMIHLHVKVSGDAAANKAKALALAALIIQKL